MTSPTTRALAALAAASAALVAVPAVSASAAAKPTPPSKTHLAEALRAGHEAAPSRTARRAASQPRTAEATAPRSPSSKGSALRVAPKAAAADCTALALDYTATHDFVEIAWTDTGAGPYTVQRMRDGGAWQTVQAGVTGTSVRDTKVNPDAILTYRVITADSTTCDLGQFVFTSTNDGWGVVEAATGTFDAGTNTPDTLLLQDEFSLAVDTTLKGVDPSFSPDGRRVVASVADGMNGWGLSVQRVNTPLQERLVPSPAGTAALDPEWSPDGTRIAYTRYDVDLSGNFTGSALRVVDVRTGTDTAVTNSTGLIQPDWVNGTTLVAADADPAGGLVFVPAAGGDVTPIAGTDTGADPDVEEGGAAVRYTTNDGTTSELRRLTLSNNTSATVLSSTTIQYVQPRSTVKAGATSLYYHVEVDTKGTADPADDTYVVVQEPETAGDPMVDTPITVGRTDTNPYWGYDLRRVLPTDTSQLALDGNSDLLAIDAKGGIFTYPVTDTSFLGPRVTIGSGWSIYNLTFIPGDLNSDTKADLLARDKSGVLWMYPGRGAGKVGARVRLGSGWSAFTFVDVGDWNGDDRADLVGRDGTGALWMYPGNGSGGFGARVKIGSGWSAYNSLTGVDFNLDGAQDMIAREAKTGYLWLYPGNGTGGFGSRVRIGSGWNTFTQITSPGLIGVQPVVYAKNASGQIFAYFGTGDGRFDGTLTVQVGSGFGSYSITS